MDNWSVDDELERLGLGSMRDARVDLIKGVADRYRELGLLDAAGRRVRLSMDCPRHCVCWRANRRELAPDDPATDAVALPWIGTRYESERILVMGTNFDGGGGLGAHWDTCREHIKAMRAGGPGLRGRPYAARAMSAVRAVRDSRARRLTEDWQPPRHSELADDWQSVAYLQAIKCAPATARGEPFAEMYTECPALTLAPELRILLPRVVIVFGRSHVRDGIRPVLQDLAGLTWGRAPGSMERDDFRLDGQQCVLFCLNHPSGRDARDWERSLSQLVGQLIADPVAS